MGGAVMLSGATGFLGSAIAEELVSSTDLLVYALVRAKAGRTPTQRLESLWCERPVLLEALGTRVVPVAANVELELLGLDAKRYDELARETGYVIHAAAEVGVNQTSQRFWNTNVLGTYNMLEFASRAAALGGLGRYVHISTAYVAGELEGHIPERLFGDDQYNSLYEKSKHEAELLLSTYEDTVPYAIVRPAQIVGDSRTGFITTFNTLYYPLKRYLRGELSVIPASRDLRVNMVPVDYVARLACKAALADGGSRVYHAVGRPEELPTLGDLVDAVRSWAEKNLRVTLPAPRYLPVSGLSSLGRLRNLRQDAQAKQKGPLRNMLALAPYFFEKRTFEVANARALMGEKYPDWREFLPHLLAFACRRGFLNYTDRTVFEQIVFRLRPGASTHVTYFDVGADGMTRRDGTLVREEIRAIARALVAIGATSGTRVATLGVNSVRYFALDCAIGLVGAVNVPIYYTSPAEDVLSLVEASGARLLFLGTDRMLDGLGLEGLDARVVSMAERRDLREGIESWDDFIAHGQTGQDAVGGLPYVSPAQMATIRYTSGTTGAPKGVVFTQQQVRWMGEVMPNVLDWKTRTQDKLRYLSFLPMSHVVEGILVAYAPYYILADIEMYYLNDFPSLVETLPKVRPNLFFSVPRFYEKLWNQFAATDAGRRWIGMPEGPAKRLLAAPLRAALLRKAGLDQCRQLIVGSAPIGIELLESFRGLGIEIHNAFGVTEAPLVTLSRLGENELGSVGRLLPDTEVRLDGEGLVYVRGPQVTRGYFAADEPVLDDGGWLCTGDLGSWSEQGNLVLEGRKKEILVTSYGKNISPQKIEVLLKGIDGVSEAMVVADGRPFTSALVWLEDEVAEAASHGGAGFDFAAFDEAVRHVNERLSHPEQVKRWIVCAHPLAVSAGELTPNLKVRRGVVAKTRSAHVGTIYDGWRDAPTGPDPAADFLHAGEA